MSGYCGYSMSNNAVSAYRCGEGSSHTNELCKLTAEQAQLLDNMSKKDCKEWCLTYQWELPVISREQKESD